MAVTVEIEGSVLVEGIDCATGVRIRKDTGIDGENLLSIKLEGLVPHPDAPDDIEKAIPFEVDLGVEWEDLRRAVRALE